VRSSLHNSLANLTILSVTVIIQGILTTLIAGALVRGDVLAKRIEPFSFAWPDVAWWQNKYGRQDWCKSRITAGE
jgi:hypothetical protein